MGIRMKLVVYVGCTLLVLLTINGYLTNRLVGTEVKKQTNQNLMEKCTEYVNKINSSLKLMQADGDSLAAGARVIYERNQQASDSVYRKDLDEFLLSTMDHEQSAYGFGVWYEPQSLGAETYVGPYVYRDAGQVQLTYDYEDPDYNFPSLDWYQLSLASPDDQYIYTTPYYDEVLDQTFITMGRSIQNYSGQTVGVITADWTLDFVKNLFSELTLTSHSLPFLIDPQDNQVLYYPDKSIVAKKVDSLSWWNTFSKDLQTSGTHRVSDIRIDGDSYTGYYSLLITGYVFGFLVPDQEAYSAVYATLGTTVLLLVITIVVMLLLIRIITGRIVKPIVVMGKHIRDIGEGDGNLNVSVPVTTKDEVGQLGEGFNLFVQKLKDMVLTIKATTQAVIEHKNDLVANGEETASSAVQISGNVKSINQQINNLNLEIQSISSSMNQIKSSILALKEKSYDQVKAVEEAQVPIEQMRSQLAHVDQLIMDRKEVTSTLTAQIESNDVIIKEAAKSNHEVAELAGQISDMSKVISNIAAQTNLLSMNAAIEAAHAGDAGRGFAVVAEEIRNLAATSQNNSKNISQSIKDIIGKVNLANSASKRSEENFTFLRNEVQAIIKALGEVEEATSQLSSGGHVIAQSNTSLDRMARGVSQDASEMEEAIELINNSTHSAYGISSQVASGMAEIQQGSSEIAEAMTNVQQITLELNQSTDELQEEMDSFKTE
ncbi:methyl-accepting chemotaxis protein [Spirochaeta cellobiosiphila]|uniref:methyl-accepting chemotaxis protein n=1 Tax=Spirochaeta cellobiosiphila TaxID=504483 RepID=UPI001FDFCAC0|nr:methyl-accepting chemotaxis protein [Spirochaeta cellobiosiphila]